MPTENMDTKPESIPVRMTPAEAALLENRMVAGADYLEFGSGGSTLLALSRGVKHCRSVEGDPDWLARMREFEPIATAEAEGRLVFEPVDIGPVGDWSIPTSEDGIRRWPAYFLSVWERLDRAPDLVLIDGRFRTACVLATLIACPSTTCVLVHDFFEKHPMRSNYRSILDIADIVEAAEDLVSLRKKDDVGNGQLLSRLESAWTDFG
jgi:hypothetical protein